MALGDAQRGTALLARAMEINPGYLEPMIDMLLLHCRDGNLAPARVVAEKIAPVFDADLKRLVEALLAHAERRFDDARKLAARTRYTCVSDGAGPDGLERAVVRGARATRANVATDGRD